MVLRKSLLCHRRSYDRGSFNACPNLSMLDIIGHICGQNTTTSLEWGMNNTKDVNRVRAQTDGHKLNMRFLTSNTSGAAAYHIWDSRTRKVTCGTVPAGINNCSYSAEIVAMIAAIVKLRLQNDNVVRICTDSQSILTILQTNFRSQPHHPQSLAYAVYQLNAKKHTAKRAC